MLSLHLKIILTLALCPVLCDNHAYIYIAYTISSLRSNSINVNSESVQDIHDDVPEIIPDAPNAVVDAPNAVVDAPNAVDDAMLQSRDPFTSKAGTAQCGYGIRGEQQDFGDVSMMSVVSVPTAIISLSLLVDYCLYRINIIGYSFICILYIYLSILCLHFQIY